jgi:hypothetical protein
MGKGFADFIRASTRERNRLPASDCEMMRVLHYRN